MIIDTHVHIFPDKIAKRALDKMSGVSGIIPATEGTASSTLALMAARGVDKAMLLSIATSPKQQSNINQQAVQLNLDPHFIALGSVHFLAEDWSEQLEYLKENGVKGIKLHPDYQDFMINDERLFPIYAQCAHLGLFICFHAGWDCYSPELIHAHPKASCEVAMRFPKLRMVLAHMGGLKLEDAVLSHLIGLKNVFFDTAMAATHMDREKVLRILHTHGVQKVFFGSDCPWEDPASTLEFIYTLGLTAGETSAILSENILAFTA